VSRGFSARLTARARRLTERLRRYHPAVADPRDDPVSGGAPDFEVTRVHWERIQLVITVRAPPDAEPGELYLRHAADPRQRLAPRPDRDETSRVRFNLFAGADRMPVEPGSWVLMRRRGLSGREVPVRCDPLEDATADLDREFVHPEWTIRITPVATTERLEVRFAVRATPDRPPTTLAIRWHRFQRGFRQRAFRAAVACARLLPRRHRLVVFTSDSRAELGGNLKLVHDRMIERGLDSEVRIRTILKESVRTRRSVADRARLPWLLARANVILVDDYQPAIYQLSPHSRVRIIQLWHAWGAFKTVGYSRIGKPGGPSPYSRVHKNYTYATVSSEHEVPFYAEAFGLPEVSVIPTGTPRMDEFLDPEQQEAGRARAHAAVPEARGHAVFLFAPTFRGDGAMQATYPTEVLDLAALHALAVERDAIVLLKMHPFVQEPIAIPPDLGDRLIDATDLSIDVNDLLLIADLLITDYSSLVFEYAALGRPMLFYAFDLEEYTASRDFYEPFESFAPGPIVQTFPDLLRVVRENAFDLRLVQRFARDHLPAEPGSATDRIIDQLIMAR
jgi:CDP-ribitol ribitolphosphotransferase